MSKLLEKQWIYLSVSAMIRTIVFLLQADRAYPWLVMRFQAIKSSALKICFMIFLLVRAQVNVFATDDLCFILRTKGNPYWNSVAQGISEAAELNHVSAAVYQGQSESSAEEQLNTCLSVIERKPKFLALVAVNSSVGVQCLKKAVAQGIRVAELDSSIPATVARDAGLKLSFSVGSDNFSIGKSAAKYLDSILRNPSDQVLVIEGAVGSDPGRQRVLGFTEEIKRIRPGIRIVASIAADWDRLKAMNIVTDLIQRFPQAGAVFAVNDLMALGAIEALKTRSRADVIVIGVDGTSDARKAILSGSMQATVAQVPYFLGKRALELAIKVVDGEEVPEREITETPVLTREILTNSESPELKYIR